MKRRTALALTAATVALGGAAAVALMGTNDRYQGARTCLAQEFTETDDDLSGLENATTVMTAGAKLERNGDILTITDHRRRNILAIDMKKPFGVISLAGAHADVTPAARRVILRCITNLSAQP